jgi:hypothetical protein
MRRATTLVYLPSSARFFHGRDPGGDGHHLPRELADAEVTQQGHILVDVPGLGAVGAGVLGGGRRLVGFGHGEGGARVVDEFHAGAAVSALHGVDRRALAAGEQGGGRQQRGQRGVEQDSHHFTPCSSVAGSTAGGKTGG